MEYWFLERYGYTEMGTFGKLKVPGLPIIYTVEQVWLNNEPSKSCVPIGEYVLSEYYSPARQRTVLLLNNEHLLSQGNANCHPRTFIEIHPANWAKELKGCIAPGDSLNNTWGVSNSVNTMNKLLDIFVEDTRLIISNYIGGIPT